MGEIEREIVRDSENKRKASERRGCEKEYGNRERKINKPISV